MNVIKIINMSKSIKKQTVLDNINYTFERGKIYGLYGRNGSGKTMLLRAIAGLITPTSGKILIDEKELHKDLDFPPNTGVIIEHTSLLPQFDAYTNLKNLSKIRKIASDDDIYRTLTAVGLENEKKKVREYSLGMRQKLAIAQAIFEKPELLLLDEPMNALDEESVNNIRNLLMKEKERTIIIIASHNKDDITFLSDVALHMESGKIVELNREDINIQKI